MKAKVMIVDDEKDYIRVVSAFLKAHDYDVIFAVDGYSAIQTAIEQRPDIVLLDMMLPVGGGMSVMERIKSLTQMTLSTIIIISGLDKTEHEQQCLDAGAAAYLQKPIDNEVLLETIEKAVG